MLHACATRFDMMRNLKTFVKFLRTKQGHMLMVDAELKRVSLSKIVIYMYIRNNTVFGDQFTYKQLLSLDRKYSHFLPKL